MKVVSVESNGYECGNYSQQQIVHEEMRQEDLSDRLFQAQTC